MTFSVILRARAEDDIRTALHWYDSHQPGIGDDFLVHLRRALASVAEPRRVVILAVLHTSRNPALWPHR